MAKGFKTGGRQKGAKNKKTLIVEAQMSALKPDGTDPITFFTQVLRDMNAPFEIRERAAKELAPYFHPKLASIEARTGGQSHEDRLQALLEMADEDEQG